MGWPITVRIQKSISMVLSCLVLTNPVVIPLSRFSARQLPRPLFLEWIIGVTYVDYVHMELSTAPVSYLHFCLLPRCANCSPTLTSPSI